VASKVGIRVSAALAITACVLLLVPAIAGAVTTGGIAGTVTAASGGAGVKGIEVCASEVVGVEGACVLTTSSTGEYTISGLAPGSYIVEFWTHREGLNLITQYYNDQPTFSAAEAVSVTAGATVPNINAQLHEGGRIAGTVTDASSHAGVGGIFVCALESITEEGACALTAPTGQYTIAGLPSGSYEVVFEGEELPGTYITQFYNDQPSFATANLVTVTAPGGTHSGIDAALVMRPLPKVPTVSLPPVVAPVLPPVAKPKPLTCKKGFQKKMVRGKATCVKKKAKRHHHRRHH
jgi:Carboxypeptidase regulatory-like domain